MWCRFLSLKANQRTRSTYILHRQLPQTELAETAAFWKMRLKLVDLLQSGLNYDAVTALGQIEKGKDLLLAELVILYGRVGPLCFLIVVIST
jgi:hypothetical protein